MQFDVNFEINDASQVVVFPDLVIETNLDFVEQEVFNVRFENR